MPFLELCTPPVSLYSYAKPGMGQERPSYSCSSETGPSSFPTCTFFRFSFQMSLLFAQ